jgi:hypothetical protein
LTRKSAAKVTREHPEVLDTKRIGVVAVTVERPSTG